MKQLLVSVIVASSLMAASAFAAGETGRPPQGNPNQAGQPGVNAGSENRAMDPAKAKVEAMCRKREPRVRQAAEACLRHKKPDKRGQCFEGIGQKFMQGAARACEDFFQPMKAEFEAQERERYPNQRSTVSEENQGAPQQGHRQQGQPQQGQPQHGQPQQGQPQQGQPQHGQPQHGQPQQGQPQQGQPQHGQPQHGQPPMGNQAPVDCGKAVAEAKKMGNACLAKGKTEQRRVCWEADGEKLHKLTGGNPACESALEPVRSEMMGAEAQKYPNQEKAFH